MFGYIEVHAKTIHLIYIGVYPHKYIGHEDNVKTGGVVGLGICYLIRICVITSYYCKVVVGLEAQFCTLLEV